MARITSIFLFSFVCYCLFPNASNAGLVSIKDINGTEVGIYDESHALVIGGIDYINGWPSLPGVKKDTKLVKDALEAKGFNVVLVINPNSQELENAFEEFIAKYGYEQNNRLLFYFAGHGHTIKPKYGGEDLGYIVPVEAPNPYNDPVEFKKVAMSMQRIEEYALSIDAKHALFIFDSCFSGSLFALSRAVPEHINYKTSKPVRQFITSGSADETVPDTSIFRQQFLAALDGEGDLNDDGYVTAVELGNFIFKNVVNYSKGAQHPQYGKIRNPNLDKGDFVIEVEHSEKEKTELSTSSLLETERQRLAAEKERLDREREELEQLKLLNLERQKLEEEQINIANQKSQLGSGSSSKSGAALQQKRDEIKKINTQLANLGRLQILGVNEIGLKDNFIAYDDGTVIDTKNNVMWWSKSIKVNDIDDAIFKSKNFRGGGYSDWRVPSIRELKTIYSENNTHKYKSIDFITLISPYVFSKDIKNDPDGANRIQYVDFRNGKTGSTESLRPETMTLLPVRNAK